MKKGLLIYKAKGTYKNIGDYIQSLAAEQFTGRDVVFVERDRLHEYSGETLKLIMNGWFMHLPENWPPSEDIIPLLTSIHINPDIGERMLSEKGIEYLKKYGPVGCRDKRTEKLLQSKGIDAYFSGCLTLTLGKTYKHNTQENTVCFVDPYYEVSKSPLALLNYFFTILSKRKIILKISRKLNGPYSFKSLLRTLSFYRTYSQVFEDELLENAEYIKHSVLESAFGCEEDKFEYARNLLQEYAASKLVVTSRIHAALPCIAMDTPVIFVVSDDLKPNGRGIQPNAKGRFEGLVELFNVMEYSIFKLKPILGFRLEKKVGFNHTIRNKQKHLKMAAELDERCTSFMNHANKMTRTTEYCDD